MNPKKLLLILIITIIITILTLLAILPHDGSLPTNNNSF